VVAALAQQLTGHACAVIMTKIMQPRPRLGCTSARSTPRCPPRPCRACTGFRTRRPFGCSSCSARALRLAGRSDTSGGPQAPRRGRAPACRDAAGFRGTTGCCARDHSSGSRTTAHPATTCSVRRRLPEGAARRMGTSCL
jgi:hypothetical protein